MPAFGDVEGDKSNRRWQECKPRKPRVVPGLREPPEKLASVAHLQQRTRANISWQVCSCVTSSVRLTGIDLFKLKDRPK